MLIKHIALVSESQRVSSGQLSVISAALQKQVIRDFAPIWKVQATVAAFAMRADVPGDYWQIVIRDDIGFAAAGIHLDDNGQPYALVDADAEISVTCSHELLEMLADPFGNRFVAGPSLKPGQGRVNYLLEVCDPSEAFTYTVNGVNVSDFYTPEFFSPVKTPGTRYSFMGVIPGPRTVLRGGYISWMVPQTGEWFQLQHFGNTPRLVSLGRLQHSAGKNWRGIIDMKTTSLARKKQHRPKR